MKFVQQKCPNCGGNLTCDLSKGKATCPYCKSEFMIKRTGERWVVDQQAVNELAKQNEHHYRVIVGILLFIVSLICLYMVFVFSDTPSTSKNDDPSIEVEKPTVEEPVISEEAISETMQTVLTDIFNKRFEDITPEEIDTIKYLGVRTYYDMDDHKDYFKVTYSFEDYFACADKEAYIAALKNITYDAEDRSVAINRTDLKLFKGLTYISYYDLDEEVLGSLLHLKGIETGASNLSELSEETDATKILVLKIDRNIENLAGLEKFSNLQLLELAGTSLTSIDEIENCQKLMSLTLKDNDEVIDYSVIGKLPSLEILDLEAEIKSVNFLKSLPKLKKLTLKGTIINQLDWLKESKQLTDLVLVDNAKITYLSPLGEMSQLKKLELQVPTYDMDLSSLGNLKQLESLNLIYVYGDTSLAFLKHLTELKEATLSSCYFEEGLGVFSNCQNLQTLTLKNLDGDLNFHKLEGLSNLRYMHLEGNAFNADISSLFSLSQLEEINLNNSSFQADFSGLKQMKNLKALYLDHVSIYSNVSVYSDGFFTSVDYDDEKLQDKIKAIGECSSLQVLSLANNELSDLSGLGNLKQLVALDISQNYIEDVTPLSKCSALSHVIAKDNIVEDWTPIGKLDIER